MTLIFDRAVVGRKTHAFVVGVGDYPHAKPGMGKLGILQHVPNLPSAADSAKLMCDWLIDNRDRLAAPLATLEVLISDPSNPNDRYAWTAGPVGRATEAEVSTQGLAWYERLCAEPGDVAFFYCCGHGASSVEQPVLFLEDLNRSGVNIWSHIDLGKLKRALAKNRQISAAFLFSDACGQIVPDFDRAQAQECRFYDEPVGFAYTSNLVSFLCAATEGWLAYEGPDAPGSRRMFGRFTQVCLQALNGSSARRAPGGWAVSGSDLKQDLKHLQRIFFGYWGNDVPFEPYEAASQTDAIPLVYPEKFELPIVVTTFPIDVMPRYGFLISERDDPSPPWLKSRNAGEASAWYTTVPPGKGALYAIAVNAHESHAQLFHPIQPLFRHFVELP